MTAAVALGFVLCGGDASADGAAGRPSDAGIVRVLSRELDRDPAVARQRVRFTSDQGIVTLRGVVSTQLVRERAVAIAHVVRGVRAIIDELQVEARVRDDAHLEGDAAAALARDPVTARQSISARARGGVVELWGDVDSEATRRIAVAEVLALEGTRRAVDYLSVRPPRARADEQLAEEADRALRLDPWVDASRVAVMAEHGAVHVDGFVRSLAERERVTDDARAAAPRKVEASGLLVSHGADDGTRRAEPWVRVSDEEIARAVRDAWVRDRRVGVRAPSVDVRSGVVVMTGAVADETAARAARADAEQVTGVARVRDAVTRLRAASAAAPTDGSEDELLRRDVADLLDRDPRLGPQDIAVDVERGRVGLRGVVRTDEDRLDAVTLASSAAGARGVTEALAVEPGPLVPSDLDMARALRREMTQSGWVSPQDVAVTVRHGVVILEGTVGSDGERAAATELSYRAGAHGVINRLEVRAQPQGL